ncbi:MAG: ATP-binding protein, partial [Chloroflexi bacterium]|nr:ATP-binding protein [Chloroflexota bacterium]
ISDTGVGIPPEHQSKLFTPFFTTKPIGHGTGLGLAIIYGIIKMHRGQINVRSQVGEGTTFTILLPVKLPGLGNTALSPAPTASDQLIGLIG